MVNVSDSEWYSLQEYANAVLMTATGLHGSG